MLALTDPTQLVSSPSPEDGNRSNFRNVLLFGFYNSDWKHRKMTDRKSLFCVIVLGVRRFPFPSVASYVTYPLLAVTSCTRLYWTCSENVTQMPRIAQSLKLLHGQHYSPLNSVQTGSGAHPASYPLGTRVSFTGSKAAGAWSWPLTSNQDGSKECLALYIQSPIRLHGVMLI
jgi:hypothetical protein